MENKDFTKEELNLIQYLQTEGYYEFRKVPNHGICALRNFIFTTGIIIGLNPNSYYGRYCYPYQHEASNSLKEWDGIGDPKGDWLKYKGVGGERENENGGCLNCKVK
jgi:hypothetical protein